MSVKFIQLIILAWCLPGRTEREPVDKGLESVNVLFR